MQVLQEYKIEFEKKYLLIFDSKIRNAERFIFDCDENGVALETELTNYQLLEECRSGKINIGTDNEGKTNFVEMKEGYIEPYTQKHIQYKIIECECGCILELTEAFTNECPKCERLYSGSGQALAPRSQWDPWGEY